MSITTTNSHPTAIPVCKLETGVEYGALDRRERLTLLGQRLDYRPAAERIRDFAEACQGFTPETASAEASRCIHCPTPQACVQACPLHNNIPAALWEIEQGNFSAAAAIYRATNPFPELCGRLCPDEYLCEGSCCVGRDHSIVRLGRLESFVADYAEPIVTAPLPATGQSVAIIGAGPAGLAAADWLIRQGHTVVVFDLQRRPGGMLVYTVPRFRLPLAVVERIVTRLKQLGVQFVMNTRIGQDLTVDDLFQQRYQAVLLATGAGFESPPVLSGTDLGGVYRATDFLRHTNLEQAYLAPEEPSSLIIGSKVAVFGGGNSALDCARTALRLGAQTVTCYHRGPTMERECRQEDQLAAEEEGIKFVALTAPVRLLGNAQKQVTGVICQSLAQQHVDDQGLSHPAADSPSLLIVDTVILATERGPDQLIAATTPDLATTPAGWIVVDRATGLTSRQGLFAAGDNTGRMQLAVEAIVQGRQAAQSIHDYLQQ